MDNIKRRFEQIPRSAIKAKPLPSGLPDIMSDELYNDVKKLKRYEILWDRFKLKYGGHRTWINVKTGENKRIHTWITLREIMRIMEEEYDKEKAET